MNQDWCKQGFETVKGPSGTRSPLGQLKNYPAEVRDYLIFNLTNFPEIILLVMHSMMHGSGDYIWLVFLT